MGEIESIFYHLCMFVFYIVGGLSVLGALFFLLSFFTMPIWMPIALKTEKKVKSFTRDKEGDLFPKGVYDFSYYPIVRDGVSSIVSIFAILIHKKDDSSEDEIKIATEYFQKRFCHSHRLLPFAKDWKQMEKGLRYEINRKHLNYREYAVSILKTKIPYEARLEMLEYMFKVAYVNGGVKDEQLELLEAFSKHMMIDDWDLTMLEYQYECQREKELPKQDSYRNLLMDSSYKILGIERTASELEIKESYRSLVKQYHPDRLSEELSIEEREEAIVMFRQATEAYQMICKEKGIK